MATPAASWLNLLVSAGRPDFAIWRIGPHQHRFERNRGQCLNRSWKCQNTWLFCASFSMYNTREKNVEGSAFTDWNHCWNYQSSWLFCASFSIQTNQGQCFCRDRCRNYQSSWLFCANFSLSIYTREKRWVLLQTEIVAETIKAPGCYVQVSLFWQTDGSAFADIDRC